MVLYSKALLLNRYNYLLNLEYSLHVSTRRKGTHSWELRKLLTGYTVWGHAIRSLQCIDARLTHRGAQKAEHMFLLCDLWDYKQILHDLCDNSMKFMRMFDSLVDLWLQSVRYIAQSTCRPWCKSTNLPKVLLPHFNSKPLAKNVHVLNSSPDIRNSILICHQQHCNDEQLRKLMPRCLARMASGMQYILWRNLI